jgi:Sulfotransferase family
MQVFVVGAARSGTTRIKTALSDAFGLPRTGEGHLYPITHELDAALGDYFDRLRARAGPKTMIQAASREDLRRSIHAAVRQAFEAVAGASFVEKTPGSAAIAALPMVVAQWPDARIVFARRRGIENVISALWKFPNWSFEASCQSWREAMAAWLGLDPTIRDRSLEIDQAEMARVPGPTAARLGAYLGLTDAQTAIIAEAFTQRAHPRANTRVSSMQELQADPLPLSATPWSEEQRAVFVTICGETMRACGYSLE